MNSLPQILLQAQSPNDDLRSQSLQSLGHLLQSNPSSFFLRLSQILFDEFVAKESRRLAGIFIKNNLARIWNTIQLDHQADIKNNCLGTLASRDLEIVKTGAMAVSTIACIEFSSGQWKDLLGVLITNAHNIENNYKHASILTLGYICEEINPEYLSKDQRSNILTAIISNISSNDKVLAEVSLNTFRKSLKYYHSNFYNTKECETILVHICGTFSAFPVLCLQILCDVAITYPESFLNSLALIGTITYAAINSSDDEICITGIEVWNTIGDNEKIRLDQGLSTLGYFETACETLTTLLLPKLFLYSDDDEWTISRASYTALSLISQICGPRSHSIVYKFVKENLQDSKSIQKVQAALLALSSMFEEPTAIHKDFVESIDKVIYHLKSSSYSIKKNAIWCFGKLCQSSSNEITSFQIFEAKDLLIAALDSSMKIRNFASWCLINIISKCYSLFDIHQYGSILDTVIRILKKKTINAGKVEIYNLLCTAIDKLPKNYIKLLEDYFQDILDLYKESLNNSDENIHSCTSSILQVCCANLPAGKFPQKDADFIVNTIIQTFDSHGKVFEESLQVLGALSMNLGLNFYQYLHKVSPYILYSICQLDSSEILNSGIIALGDLARSLGTKISDFIEEMIPPLIKVLESPQVLINSKILSINTLGDLAEATKEKFIFYLDTVLSYLDTAAGISLQISEDIDFNEYLADLRECILQFYVGLVHGLADCETLEAIRDKIPQLVMYIKLVVNEKYAPNDFFHEVALGLIGDILENYKDTKSVSEILGYVKGFLSYDNSLSRTSKWILSMTNGYEMYM